ncbi:hypothetical protein CRYUN_Cryun09bG0114500 [Craigia yunnanensis]
MMNLFEISITLCFLALALDAVFLVGSQDLPQDFLDAHNAARKEVGVPSMTWDNVLEAYALNYSQGRIDNCDLVRAVVPSGQNLAWSSNDLSGTDAVKLWVDEKMDYDLESGFCASGRVCNHYTQVIWINSTQLGCAKVRCNDNGTFIACYYYPPGNIPGLVTWFISRRKKKRENEFDDHVFDMFFGDEFGNGMGPRKFSLNELAKVTSNFNTENKLGEGGFGSVYRGYLRDLDTYIAVKRVSGASKQGIKEYASEVKIISRLRHKNLVKLIGWCHEKWELMLVYEFMANGSLDTHLFKGKSLLTLEVRYKIVQDLA